MPAPKLKETKPLPNHINAGVLNTEIRPVYVASVLRTDRVEVDMEFTKVVRVNKEECIRWRDTRAQITLIKGSMVQKTDMLPDQKVELLAVRGDKIPMPLAKVHVEWEDSKGVLTIGVLDIIPMEMLLGNAILRMAKASNVVTCSKREYCAGIPVGSGRVPETVEKKGEGLFNSSAAEGNRAVLHW